MSAEYEDKYFINVAGIRRPMNDPQRRAVDRAELAEERRRTRHLTVASQVEKFKKENGLK